MRGRIFMLLDDDHELVEMPATINDLPPQEDVRDAVLCSNEIEQQSVATSSDARDALLVPTSTNEAADDAPAPPLVVVTDEQSIDVDVSTLESAELAPTVVVEVNNEPATVEIERGQGDAADAGLNLVAAAKLAEAESDDILNPDVTAITHAVQFVAPPAGATAEIPENKLAGLTQQEADDALVKFGHNALPTKKRKNPVIIFLKQLKDIMILLLTVAMLTSIAVFLVGGLTTANGTAPGFDFKDIHTTISLAEPFIILLIIIMYMVIGGVQELQSIKAVESLKKLSSALATVVRDGQVKKIPAHLVVPGDLLLVEAGDAIAADAEIIECYDLECIEASLTGESAPVSKTARNVSRPDAPLAEQRDKIFSGTSVANGQAKCRVFATGVYTQIGRVASLIDNQKTFVTPLQLKLNKLGHIFGYAGLALFFIVFIIQILILGTNIIAETWSTALTTSIALAVAAIPEGLGAFTTIILSIGIKRMAKQNALIKKISSVETLGSTSVICTDKTGTLTMNKMTLNGIWHAKHGALSSVSEPLPEPYADLVKKYILCSNSHISVDAEGKRTEVGDPTELAVISYGLEQGIDKRELDVQCRQGFSLPFDSGRKMMTSVNLIDGQWTAIVKGAPEILLEKCVDANREQVQAQLSLWAKKAYRVLMIAMKHVGEPNANFGQEYLENDLTLIGLVAIYDPPRPEAKAAIARCVKAGIKTVMITGDNIDTARAIAREIGILRDDIEAIDGKDLQALSDVELASKIEQYAVYARATPADKLRVVHAWQANDQVVAMTGDGVNDAPALRAADIGCAMGITGTDVAKEAADMILTDDNFKTIVSAVSNGRRIYQTIKLVIQNVLLSSVAEILVMLLGIIIFRYAFESSLTIPGENNQAHSLHIFGTTQLLVINLITDGFPAIALGIIGTREDLMSRRPYSKFESIFAQRMGVRLLWQGLLFGLITLVAFALGTLYSREHWFNNNIQTSVHEMGYTDLHVGSAAAFITLAVGISLHALNMMSTRSILSCNVKEHKLVYIAVLVSIGLTLVLTLVPDVAAVFNMPNTLVTNGQFVIGIAFALAFVPIIVIECYKRTYWRIRNEVLKTASVDAFAMIKRPDPHVLRTKLSRLVHASARIHHHKRKPVNK